MKKTIFILLDGCGFDVATENLGFLEHLVQEGQGGKYKILGELPSSSRPIYETLLTGLSVFSHGIVNNSTVRRSKEISVFDLCVDSGLKTAASAYYWISELYVRAPFDPDNDRIRLQSESAINYGIYYYEDIYPDSHVFNDAEFLRKNCSPDFLFIHSMNLDDSGHHSGCHSKEHHMTALKVNELMATFMPKWLNAGYQVIVTADHGMSEMGLHGGNTEVQRIVPLYLFSERVRKGSFCESTISQLLIAPLLCDLLGIEKSPKMKNLEDLGVDLFEK
ncbi:MAG: nucleotide pyrophosphatase [Firmicutes bacterium HGW-Firmicutes-7]|nr:MAG: nucleotide pyrophosphatase [Firmicutes bacterium HGW-Firmicutes-7]